MLPPIVIPPDDKDFDLRRFKEEHAYHFNTNEHVSVSPFRAYFGSTDCGCRLQIPPAGDERRAMNLEMEKKAQTDRCRALRK